MSGLVFRTRKARGHVQLNVTPLIDVLFLFIIFFMLTGTFKRVGELELRLPGSSTAVPSLSDETTRTLELLLTEGGGLYLDGEEVELPGLKSRLQGILRADPESRVMLKAERGVPHGQVVLLLDIVRTAGFRGVGIGTHMEPPEEETRTR